MILADIRGHRIQELLVARDGAPISWTALNVHDDTFDNVVQFQFVQETPGAAILKLVPSTTFGDADRERILARLARRLDGQISIQIETTETIRLTSRGKMIYVDQRIPGIESGMSSDTSTSKGSGRQ